MKAAACLLSLAIVTEAALLKDPVAYPYFDVRFSDGHIGTKAAHRTLQYPPEDEYKYRLIHDGREKYLCAIPNVTDSYHHEKRQKERLLTGDERAAVQAKAQAKAAAAAQRAWKLLKKLDGLCLYRLAGWWTYQFCIGKSVEQFHAAPFQPGVPVYPPRPDVEHASFTLGARPAKSAKGRPIAKAKLQGSAKSLSVFYEGGSYCPLTRSPRRTEVRFQCCHSDSEHIASVKEVSTCEYLLIVHTARLCNDEAFMEESAKPNEEIICTLISDAPAELAAKKQRKRQELAVDDLGDYVGFFASITGKDPGTNARPTDPAEATEDIALAAEKALSPTEEAADDKPESNDEPQPTGLPDDNTGAAPEKYEAASTPTAIVQQSKTDTDETQPAKPSLKPVPSHIDL
jgi:hypothetical protein